MSGPKSLQATPKLGLSGRAGQAHHETRSYKDQDGGGAVSILARLVFMCAGYFRMNADLFASQSLPQVECLKTDSLRIISKKSQVSFLYRDLKDLYQTGTVTHCP
jgi:hypothetical protein